MANLQLCFQVDLVIMLCTQAVPGLPPVLAHHDYRGLDGGKAGEDKV
jgi:hypothetical protein